MTKIPYALLIAVTAVPAFKLIWKIKKLRHVYHYFGRFSKHNRCSSCPSYAAFNHWDSSLTQWLTMFRYTPFKTGMIDNMDKWRSWSESFVFRCLFRAGLQRRMPDPWLNLEQMGGLCYRSHYKSQWYKGCGRQIITRRSIEDWKCTKFDTNAFPAV